MRVQSMFVPLGIRASARIDSASVRYLDQLVDVRRLRRETGVKLRAVLDEFSNLILLCDGVCRPEELPITHIMSNYPAGPETHALQDLTYP